MTARQDVYRRKPPVLPRTPEGEERAGAIRRLTASPDWQIVMDHLKATTYERFMNAPLEPGAFLEIAVRRNVIAEIENLSKRVTDDDRTDHRE